MGTYVNEESFRYDSILAITIFLFQMLNVVNLNWFVKERLFIFMFAGQDGNLDNEGAARADVWNALIAKEIYAHFGFFRFLVVMLGFDDYDFQMLVLEADETLNRSSFRTPIHANFLQSEFFGLAHAESIRDDCEEALPQ